MVCKINTSDGSVFNFDNSDEIKTFRFDLNEDVTCEKFEVSFWYRWGLMNRDIHFDEGSSAKRLDVLTSKTRGYHNLVLDFDTMWVWDGDGFGGSK
jgi:hypothetical protein